jgi:hypothetical protein
VVSEGPGIALGRLVPSGDASLWTWLNSLSALLALGAWTVALGLFLRARRSAGEDTEPEP